jgi:hypothetical protein
MNLPQTACVTVIGNVSSSSIEPLLRSSAHSRMAVEGTINTNSRGRLSKNSLKSACRISKKPSLNGRYPAKNKKITRKTYATGVAK